MHWRVLAVVLLAVTAGCGSVVGLGGNGTPEPVTPAPVPSPPPTPDDPRVGVAPGLSAEGIFDLDYLVQDHVESLRRTSYAWSQRVSQARHFGNGTTSIVATQNVTVENGTTFHRSAENIDERLDGDFTFFEQYDVYVVGGEGFARYRSFDTGLEYRRYAESQRAREYPSLSANAIRRYLPLENATVARIDVGERPHYRLAGTRSELPQYGPVRNYSARAVIREDGVVRRLNVSYDYVAPNGVFVAVHHTFTYDEFGTATVTEPAWLPTARETVASG